MRLQFAVVSWVYFFLVYVSGQSQRRYSIGNAGVTPAADIYHSPSLPPSWNFSWSPEEKKMEFDLINLDFINSVIQVNATIRVSSIEYIVIWAAVENEGQNMWNFSQVIDDMTAIKQFTNVDIIPYMYTQAMPSYIRNNYTQYERSQCLEHSLDTEYLSTFGNTTVPLMSRFYNVTSTVLKNFIPTQRNIVVRFALTPDFGEVGYPAGFAQSIFPVPHVHAGFWVQETSAQNRFRTYMMAKYGSISAINRAWNTTFANPSAIQYPNVIGEGPLSGTIFVQIDKSRT